MKKVFAFLLAAALLCSLCACGTKPAAQEDTRSAADIWQAMQAGIDPDDLPYLEEVDAQVLENFYGLTEAQAASFLCLFPQMNVIATEILIVKCVSGQEQAVLSATAIPAREIGRQDEIGAIVDGMYADFVVCGEDLTRQAVYLGGKPL